MSRGFLDCLKRERDIFIKPTSSGEKMAFMCTPALSDEILLRGTSYLLVMRSDISFSEVRTQEVEF